MLTSRRFWLGTLVTLLFLALFLRRVDLGDVLADLRSIDYRFIALAIIAYFIGFWFRAIRWRLILSPVHRVPLGRLYWVLAIGYAANNILPLRLGEIVRIYLLRRRPGVGASSTLGTIAVERVMDGLTLVSWIAVIFLTLVLSGEVLTRSFAIAALLFALLFGGAAVALLFMVLLPELTRRIATLVLRPLPDAWTAPLLGLLSTFLIGLHSLRSGRALVQMAILSFLTWAGEAVVYVFVAAALGLSASLMALLLAVALSNLAVSLPSSSGGIGPFEAGAKESLVLFGVGASAAAAYAVLIHAVLIIPVCAVGLLFLWGEGITLAQATHLDENLQPAPARDGESTRDAE